MFSSFSTYVIVRGVSRCIALVLGTLLAAQLGACASSAPAKGYDTPEAAVDSLVAALRSNDQKELHSLPGPESDDLLDSGDQVADANGRAEFLKHYDEKHKVERRDENSMPLDVGQTYWPLPIPVVKGEKGWYFDTPAG